MSVKSQVTKMKDLVKQAKASKAIIAKERDKLRALISDLESELESFDQGVESLEFGIREIKDGVNSLSHFV